MCVKGINLVMDQYHVAVLGHVDAGKTALTESLHNSFGGILSTAALDKAPESQTRGITMDLGMSNIPSTKTCSKQICFVDCPGHSSLLSTTLGGTSIVDTCLLIIDATTGPQAQTLECFVVAEILYNDLIVVLTKVDKLKPETKDKHLSKLIKGLENAFSSFHSSGRLHVCVTSALTGEGLEQLVQTLEKLANSATVMEVPYDAKTIFSYDHAFAVPGQGPIVTGRVMSGKINVNDSLLWKDGTPMRIKTIQCFKSSVQSAKVGERVALNIPKLPLTKMSGRGMITNFLVPSFSWCIAELELINRSKDLFQKICSSNLGVDVSEEMLWQLGMGNQRPIQIQFSIGHELIEASVYFLSKCNDEESFIRIPCLPSTGKGTALIHFNKGPRGFPLPIKAIGLRQEISSKEKPCRILTHGEIVSPVDDLSKLLIYRNRQKICSVEAVLKSGDLRCVGGFQSAEHVNSMINSLCYIGDRPILGKLEKCFGNKGKFLVNVLCGDELKDVHTGDEVRVIQRTEVHLKC
eukprot:GHVH01002187.1.p2 GENE.GHVH01002187.1~~GHVH01002187.1.p2  ORF type:complete len:521 (-),score=76.75 GHVH01002187.1:1740-3302(-)